MNTDEAEKKADALLIKLAGGKASWLKCIIIVAVIFVVGYVVGGGGSPV